MCHALYDWHEKFILPCKQIQIHPPLAYLWHKNFLLQFATQHNENCLVEGGLFQEALQIHAKQSVFYEL